MPAVPLDTKRYDPYLGYRFKVKFADSNNYVAAVTKMGALKRSTAPVVHREGGDPSHERKSPGKSTFDAVTLERGVTQDRDFEKWAKLVNSYKDDTTLKNFRKNVTVDLFNEQNQVVLSYHLLRCWVSEYTALPALDAGNAAVAIESIKLEVEGWERDGGVKPPDEK